VVTFYRMFLTFLKSYTLKAVFTLGNKVKLAGVRSGEWGGWLFITLWCTRGHSTIMAEGAKCFFESLQEESDESPPSWSSVLRSFNGSVLWALKIVCESLTQSPFFGLCPLSKFHRTLRFGSWLLCLEAEAEPASEILCFFLIQMMDKVQIKGSVSVSHLVVSAYQFTNFYNYFQIVSSWWPPTPWIILRVINPLSESFNPFSHMYKIWLHFCRQFQAFLVCVLMFSQVVSIALCLLFVLWWPKNKIYILGWYRWTDWAIIIFH
jgi:hypothetical protein